jgi:hypothetical protein
MLPTKTFTLTALMHTFTLASLWCAGGCGVETSRTVDVDEPLAAIETGDEPGENGTRETTGEVATISGPANITLVANDGDTTMAYALTLEIDDIAALPLDEAVEAGPGLAVRIIEIGAGEIPVINEAACARLNDPSPACDREVTLYETSPPRAHTGVMTLWTNEDVLTGVVDAEISDDESARGTFSIDI